jgi:LPS sulfotransferase NodH
VIVAFIAHRLATNPRFHAADVHAWALRHGYSAPASADRVMRALRVAGEIAYVVVSRSESLYQAVELAECAA